MVLIRVFRVPCRLHSTNYSFIYGKEKFCFAYGRPVNTRHAVRMSIDHGSAYEANFDESLVLGQLASCEVNRIAQEIAIGLGI